MIAVTVCYPAGVAFDRDYYFATHCPLIEQNLHQKAEVRTILATGSGKPAPYQVITTLYFDDLPTMQTKLGSPEGKAVNADVKNFFAGQPEIMIGEVAA